MSVEQVAQLEELGLLKHRTEDKFTMGDVRGIGLMRDLQMSGLPLDGLAAEIRTGRLSLDFLDNPFFDKSSAFSNQTFEDVSASTGIPVDTLLVIPEAIGAAVRIPSDRMRVHELDIVPMIQAQVASGYSLPTVERGLRTMGDAVRRLSIAEADAFRRAVVDPVALQAGVQGSSISAAVGTATQRIMPTTDQALLAVYHGQQRHAWTAGIFENWEGVLAAAGLYDTAITPPAMCFLDITGYTRLTAERGDEAAAELARDLATLVQRTSMQHGGRAVKWLGDGVMLFFRQPGAGVLAALEMAQGVAAAGLPPAHVGLHAGQVVMQDGDYYGQTVNIASRIAEYARQGEVVVSQAVVDAAADFPLQFADLGDIELKGVTGTVRLHAARRSG